MNQTLLGILIPLLLVAVFGYLQVSDLLTELEEHTKSEISVTTRQIEREFQFVLGASRQLSETMAVNGALLDALEERESDYLYQWGARLVSSGLVSGVIFVDSDGIVLARGHEEHRFNDSIFSSPSYSGINIQETFSGLVENGNEWMLTTITPVFRFDVLHRGSIIIEKAVSQEFLRKLEVNYNINQIRISRDFKSQTGMLGLSKGYQLGSRMLQIPCLGSLSCSITIAKDLTAETDAFRELESEIIAFTAIVFLAALLFIYFGTRRALRPIRTMHDHLKDFRDGSFSFEMLITRMRQLRRHKTEMGLIATSVSNTLTQLQASQDELKKANQEATRAEEETAAANEELRRIQLNLEDMVDDRTSELLRKTDQLEAEIIERNKAEQRYRLLVENATDAIFVIQKGTIRFPNPKTIEMFGFSESECQTIRFLDLVAAEDRHLFSRNGKSLLPDEQLSGIRSFNMLHKNKHVIRVQMNSVQSAWEGQPGLLCFVRDITEYKRTQEILIQSEKMLSVGGLAAGMAHEINNPLAGMMQSAQLAMSRLLDDHPANEEAAREAGITMDAIRKYNSKRRIDRYLENINRAGTQAARIVNNMLSFARKSEATQQTVSLAEIVDSTLVLAGNDYDLKKEYDFKRIQIDKELDAAVPPVDCEVSMIQQVIFNIIKNAAEAMCEAGSLGEDSRIVFRTKQVNGMAQLEIEDNGPGIDESVRKRVFEPFFTTKSVDKGTGLGLSVSYFIIVENHGGELEVASNQGVGTTFIIRLPLPESKSLQAG